VWRIFHSFRVEKYPISGRLKTDTLLSICYYLINKFFHLNGISFATVQIKEHFYCTKQKRYVINDFARMKNRVEKLPARKIEINAGRLNNGIKGINTLSIATK